MNIDRSFFSLTRWERTFLWRSRVLLTVSLSSPFCSEFREDSVGFSYYGHSIVSTSASPFFISIVRIHEKGAPRNKRCSDDVTAQLRILEATEWETGSWACATNIELIMGVDVDVSIATFDISDQFDTGSNLHFGHSIVVGNVATEFDTDAPEIGIGTTSECRVGCCHA